MTIEPLSVEGVHLFSPAESRDERGGFVRVWDSDLLSRAGLCATFVQQSVAWNARKGTLRGMHVVLAPAREEKIVRCIRGAIHDVVFDARPRSATFGRHVAVRLDERERRALYIPAGCAHGYQTLEDASEVQYDISEPFQPDAAGGIAYDDPVLGIRWPLEITVMSERDRARPRLDAFLASQEMHT